MPWHRQVNPRWRWRRAHTSAWGAVLDGHAIMLAALSRQKSGTVRVVLYEQGLAPQDLLQSAERDHWLLQSLQAQGAHWPAHARVMVLALDGQRCREGHFDWPQAPELRRLQAEVMLEAALAWGVGPDAVAFDFRVEAPGPDGLAAPAQVHWAACLLQERQQWQAHARRAGWRLPAVEPVSQAVQRAATHLRTETMGHAASARDWQFDPAPQRSPSDVDMQHWRDSPLWRPLAACGAALGALL